MIKQEAWLNKLDMKSWFWIIGIIGVFGINQIGFNPIDYLRIIAPILLTSSFVLLGVFALTEIRKTIKEHYSRRTKSILRDIEGMREKQKYEDLDSQIKLDQEILSMRESLKGFERNYFEKCVVYSSVLFAIALLLTFIDLGKYLQVPNLVPLILFFFWGLFYFAKMLQAIFFALNIINLD
jgi:hypothetical protein